ncbi:hypothetical protein LWI28_010048 [Acer negundo]|uniref:Uncharacterized protein n=1 Tax=Acer negundo TaxID=4023 RepID=A0AAD5IZD0_ACENE|nr:hypothetical protein LWI28_010048 [Acer negundo]KAK4849692.1 hypothetical protein QYF36_027473 [Acer negundo]
MDENFNFQSYKTQRNLKDEKQNEDQTESLLTSEAVDGWTSMWTASCEVGPVSMRGRSLASSSSSRSVVLRLMQEQRSSDAKKAVATLVPTQLATRSSLSQDMKLQLFSIAELIEIVEIVSVGFVT